MLPVTFAHMALNCQDPIALEKFYTTHFGFQRVRVVPIPDGQIVFIRSGHLTFELFQATKPTPTASPTDDGYQFPGWRHISFQVENVDAKLNELTDQVQVMLGPLDFDEVIPGWRSAWVADPEGNIVEITQGFVDQENPPSLT